MKYFFVAALALVSLTGCPGSSVRVCGFYTNPDGKTVQGCFEKDGQHYKFEGGFKEAPKEDHPK